MKGSAVGIFSIVLFLFVIAFFTTNILQTSTQINPTFNNTNLTFQNGGVINNLPTAPLCTIYPDIAGLIIDGAKCGINYTIWIINLAALKSNYQWFGIILIAIVAVLGYIILKVISGFIPTAGGVH